MKIFLNQNEKKHRGILLLSDAFYESLIQKGWIVNNDTDSFYDEGSFIIRERRPHIHAIKGKYELNEITLCSIPFRTHSDVISTIEELGLDACIHQGARPHEKAVLKIVEVPDDIHMDALFIEYEELGSHYDGLGVEYLVQRRR